MSDACRHAREHIYAYLDGELTADALDAIAAHLDACPPCERSFAFESTLQASIRRHLASDAPPELIARLQALVGGGAA